MRIWAPLAGLAVVIGACGFAADSWDGYYETWLSHGHALAFGFAYNAKNALVMRTDLERIARQIA